MMRTSGWKHRPLPGSDIHNNNTNIDNNNSTDQSLRLNEMYGRALYRSATAGLYLSFHGRLDRYRLSRRMMPSMLTWLAKDRVRLTTTLFTIFECVRPCEWCVASVLVLVDLVPKRAISELVSLYRTVVPVKFPGAGAGERPRDEIPRTTTTTNNVTTEIPRAKVGVCSPAPGPDRRKAAVRLPIFKVFLLIGAFPPG